MTMLLIEGRLPALATQDPCGGLSLDSAALSPTGVVIGYMPLYIGQTEQRNTISARSSCPGLESE